MEILTVMLFGQGNDSTDNDLWARDYGKCVGLIFDQTTT